MDGDARRIKILEILNSQEEPISGNELAKCLGVSRQVIVQDIALLRAVNKNILSTNKGYLLYSAIEKIPKFRRIFKVNHKQEDIEDELYTIVDLGGKMLDVVVEHDIYGQITVDLILSNRQDVDEFIRNIREKGTKPLNELTKGLHYHTIEADSVEILDSIEKGLMQKGYLIIE